MELREQSPATQGQKVRASCDRCQASKVRCSRTKPACWRCSQAGQACVYGPYRRIGRPPKQQTATGANNKTRKRSPTASASPAFSSEGNDSHGNEDEPAQPFPDFDDGAIDAELLQLTGEDHTSTTVSMASPSQTITIGTTSDTLLSTTDAVLGVEPGGMDGWDMDVDVALSDFLRSQETPLPPHLSLQHQQTTPPYSGPGSTSATNALWPELTHSTSADGLLLTVEPQTPHDWFGTGIITPPTPAPSFSAGQQHRPSFSRRPSAPSPISRGPTTEPPTAPLTAWGQRRPGLTAGATRDMTSSAHMLGAGGQCPNDCYAMLSRQLSALGVMDPTEGAPVPFDALLSAHRAAQAAQTRTLECDRCTRGTNAQTTLLLLAMAVEKLVGLFEAWHEDQGDESPSSDGISEREFDAIVHPVGSLETASGSRREGVEGCERGGGQISDKVLLAGSFVVEGHGVKAAFLTHLLGLRLERLGAMVSELEKRVEDGTLKRVGARVAGEMLHDVQRRIFFLKGKVQLSSH